MNGNTMDAVKQWLDADEGGKKVDDIWPLLKLGDAGLLAESDVSEDFQMRRLSSESEEKVQSVLEALTESMCAVGKSYKQCNGPFVLQVPKPIGPRHGLLHINGAAGRGFHPAPNVHGDQVRFQGRHRQT